MRARSALAALGVLLMSALCIRLGFWQLGRLEQRRARNAVVARGLTAPPVTLAGVAARALRASPSAWGYRRVVAQGEYDGGGEVLLRGRSHAGQPGVHVVTPLRLAGGAGTLLVNRGWLPAPDGVRPARRPPVPGGTVRVEGVLMPLPETGNRGAPIRTTGGLTTYHRLDGRVLRAALGGGLLPLYLQRTAAPGESLPRALPLPELDEGPHLGYAVQWFGFAATGLIGLLILVLRGRSRAPP